MKKTSKFHSKHHNQKWYYELTLIFAKYAFNSFAIQAMHVLLYKIFQSLVEDSLHIRPIRIVGTMKRS